MNQSDADALLKSFRKKPLFDKASLPVQFNHDQTIIKRLIPHRSPLLFVDQLTGLDLGKGLMAGSRTMDPKDPVFAGHFPDYAVYPGNFTIETIGQLGLCLYYFVANQRETVATDAQPISLRATKVAGALFLEPIRPGDQVTLLCQQLSFDGYFAAMIGQALVGDKVAVVTIGEVMIMAD